MIGLEKNTSGINAWAGSGFNWKIKMKKLELKVDVRCDIAKIIFAIYLILSLLG